MKIVPIDIFESCFFFLTYKIYSRHVRKTEKGSQHVLMIVAQKKSFCVSWLACTLHAFELEINTALLCDRVLFFANILDGLLQVKFDDNTQFKLN